MIRAVFDCVILLQAAARTTGPAGACVQAVRDGRPELILAIAAGARYLVSRDRDLLDLMCDDEFRRRFPALEIVAPVTLLRELNA